jgi:hypothetical protein
MQWDGQKISAPGIYAGLPLEVYHSDCCVGPSISSSGLRTIDSESPAHYWMSSYLNPERIPEERKDHFTLGQAAHHLFLGEADFGKKFVLRPDKWADWRTKEARDWRREQEEAGFAVLTADVMWQIKGMATSLAREPLIQQGLLSGEIERSMIWQDPETGIWLKSRPDAIPNDTLIVDLKTTSSAAPEDVRRALASNGYHMQLALAGMGMEATLNRRPANDDYVLVFVESKPPYCVNIKPVDAEAIEYGRRQIRRAIRTFAKCLETGEWPGYADSGVTAHLPQFYLKQLQQQEELGLLPEVA